MNRRFLAGMTVVMLAFAVGGCSIPDFRVKGNYVEDARCDLNMKMIYVKGGTFQMGATSEQGYDVDKDEKPVHTVTLESYYIAECEVTQSQWCKVMGTSIYQQHGNSSPYGSYSASVCCTGRCESGSIHVRCHCCGKYVLCISFFNST